MVQITSVSPVLPVPDVFRTAEYYRDVLGFSFDQIYGQPPSFVILERGSARLMFRQPREPAAQPSAAATTCLVVDDVEALAEELRGSGVEIETGPIYRQTSNGKELEVRDCNGNLLWFFQAMD